MIATKEFSISKKEYFKILAQLRFRKSWPVYAFTIFFAVYLLNDFGKDTFSTFFVIYGMFLTPFVFLYLYFWTHSNKNKIVFVPRQLTIDNEKISTTIDGALSEIPLKYITKIIELKQYWLIYISKSQFVFVPKTVFHSESDCKEFEELIKRNNPQ
jgi:hypothetical protein